MQEHITTSTDSVLALSWSLGWASVLAGFASGALIGLGFHRDEFLGGYGSLRRRMTRLGHIAFVALGILNLLYGLAPTLGLSPDWPEYGSVSLAVGTVAMPLVCFLTAWRPGFRHLFFIPVIALVVGALSALLGGLS
jgi:hypothetical protein